MGLHMLPPGGPAFARFVLQQGQPLGGGKEGIYRLLCLFQALTISQGKKSGEWICLLWLGVLRTSSGAKNLFFVSSGVSTCYSWMAQAICAPEEWLYNRSYPPDGTKRARSRRCSAGFSKLGTTAISNPFLEAHLSCVSPSLVIPL